DNLTHYHQSYNQDIQMLHRCWSMYASLRAKWVYCGDTIYFASSTPYIVQSRSTVLYRYWTAVSCVKKNQQACDGMNRFCCETTLLYGCRFPHVSCGYILNML